MLLLLDALATELHFACPSQKKHTTGIGEGQKIKGKWSETQENTYLWDWAYIDIYNKQQHWEGWQNIPSYLIMEEV